MTTPDSLRRQLFYSPWAALTTTLLALVLLMCAWWLFDWAVWRATTVPVHALCKEEGRGACWGFVAEKWRLIVFGRYPFAAQWRPAWATAVVLLALLASAWPLLWRGWGLKLLGVGWVLALLLFFVLMRGGVWGLAEVGSEQWGGLPLTVILTLLAMALSTPLGVLLALARRSHLPLLRALASSYIELVRGVPLLTVLFLATFVLPLVLPQSWRLDPLLRIVIALVLFQAAYMAETVRGGLQTLPRGQVDAARSLGMGYWQVQTAVVLPQALVAVIPAFVNNLLSTFMDTSLVTVVSMVDLSGGLRLALGDPLWRDFFVEGYLFIAAIYFSASLLMSRYSLWLERRQHAPR
jgi:general L-amino acid transport system permease protein